MWVYYCDLSAGGIVMPIRLIMNCELIADRLLLIQVFSTYNKTARRQYERSTSAHNTVTVGNKDSSEVGRFPYG